MFSGSVRSVLVVASLIGIASPRPRWKNYQTSLCAGTAINLVEDLVMCTSVYMLQTPSFKAISRRINGLPTKAELIDVMEAFCKDVIPAGKACLAEGVKLCNATFQSKVNELAETGVGYLCQPAGGQGINPAFSAIFHRISEDEFARGFGDKCPGEEEMSCLENLNVRTYEESPRMSLDTFMPLVRRDFKIYFLCVINKYKSLKNTCPFWRVRVLSHFQEYFRIPILGLNMPFSVEDMEELLEL